MDRRRDARTVPAMWGRRRRRNQEPLLAQELAAVRDAVIAERQPLAAAVAGTLHGETLTGAHWDPRAGALRLETADGRQAALLCDDEDVAAQVAVMCGLESTRCVALARGGRILLEVWSASWRFHLAAVPVG